MNVETVDPCRSAWDGPTHDRDAPARRSSTVPRLRTAKLLAMCGIAVSMSLCGACSTIDKVRRGSDLASTVVQHYDTEVLVQIEVERQRLRKARCLSPLLTPAAISAASVDYRLGSTWIDELLRDCPAFAAFISDLAWRRSRYGEPLRPSDDRQSSAAPAETTELPLSSVR